ncbi:nuclear transport factor 2 family protein [candidate division KSB1 bacterium]|nr:nuclear transport factor 2 family protein [candidate division KSB1 bacterium]
MKKLLLITAVTACLLFSCSVQIRNEPDAEIVKVVQAFHTLFDAKDLHALTALCNEDMYWYTLNGRTLHRDDIIGFFLPMFAGWEKVKTTLSGIQVMRTGRLAVVRYQSVIQITSKRGESTMKNLLTTVLVKESGVWKIWQHHMSTE